jgi:O-methyltransferase involved in polyketide biosynthesis
MSFEEELNIRLTNDDATECRYSTAHAGYMEEEFVGYFIKSLNSPTIRKSPLIHRGTYLRCKSIDHVTEWFMNREMDRIPKQIISFGAGFDTRYFRFKVNDCIDL